jgi:hypothetical protein
VKYSSHHLRAWTRLHHYLLPKDDLIASKLAAGRLRDLADVQELREAEELREAPDSAVPPSATKKLVGKNRTALLSNLIVFLCVAPSAWHAALRCAECTEPIRLSGTSVAGTSSSTESYKL